jgi:hypothetical protein
VNQVACRICGDGSHTLRRVRDAQGRKTHPAAYKCAYGCVKLLQQPIIVMPKDELWAQRKPMEKEVVDVVHQPELQD